MRGRQHDACYFVATTLATRCWWLSSVECYRLPQSPAKSQKRISANRNSRKLKSRLLVARVKPKPSKPNNKGYQRSALQGSTSIGSESAPLLCNTYTTYTQAWDKGPLRRANSRLWRTNGRETKTLSVQRAELDPSPLRLTCSVDSGSPLPEAVVLTQKMKVLLALDVLLEIGPPDL